MNIDLTPKEADLISEMRRIKFGAVKIIIRKGEPITIKEGFKNIILGRKKDLTKPVGNVRIEQQ